MQKTTPNTRTRIILSASILFILLAALYFLPLDIPYKTALPLAILTIMSPWILPWQMCLAMLFSAAGDAAGAYGSFILQISFFALAHIMLIVFFISRALKEKLYSLSGYSSRSGSAQFVLAFILTVIAMGLLAFSTAVFAPAAPDITVRSAVSAYSAIILIMLWTALAQKDLAFAAAAVLFVFSDAVLAWNRYVSPVPGETYIVMIPYYIAQLTLFIRSSIQPQVYRQA